MKSYHISDLFKTSWAELTVQQMAAVIDMRLKMIQARTNELHAAAGHYAIMILAQLRKKAAVGKMTEEQVVDCINDLTFINDSWFTFPTIDPNPVRPQYFAPPDTHLKNHTLGQLYWIDSLFSKFFIQEYYDSRAHPPQTPSDIAQMFLDEMIAIIYTHPDAFDEKLISERGRQMGKMITHDHRTCILYTYANIKEFMLNEFPLTFPQAEKQEAEEPSLPKEPVDSEPMWQNLLFDLSECPSYQGMDRTKKAPLYEALNYLEKKHKEMSQRKKA